MVQTRNQKQQQQPRRASQRVQQTFQQQPPRANPRGQQTFQQNPRQQPQRGRMVQMPRRFDTTPLKNMLEYRSETYTYPPLVQGPFLLNISDDLIKLACGAMLAKATDSRAGPDGRWKSAEELERDVLLEFYHILLDILKRAIDNATELKRMDNEKR